MMALPRELLQLLADVPDGQPCKVVLNTNGKGHWEVEIFARHSFDARQHPLDLAVLLTLQASIDK